MQLPVKKPLLFFFLFFIVLVSGSVPVFADPIQSNSLIKNFNLEVPFGGLKEIRIATTGNEITFLGLGTYVQALYTWSIGAIAILAVLMIMVGGLQWLTSGGGKQAAEAQKTITAAVIGLVLALSSNVLLYTINPDLVALKIPGLGAKIEAVPIALILNKQTSGGGEQGSANVTADNTGYNDKFKETERLLTSVENRDVSCTLMKSFMLVESSGQANAQSSVGAQGLMQVMPDTATFIRSIIKSAPYTGTELATKINSSQSNTDPQTNILLGATYLHYLRKNACNGKASNADGCNASQIKFLAAAYNAGPGRNAKDPNACNLNFAWLCFSQTTTYVQKIESLYNKLTQNNWGC